MGRPITPDSQIMDFDELSHETARRLPHGNTLPNLQYAHAEEMLNRPANTRGDSVPNIAYHTLTYRVTALPSFEDVRNVILERAEAAQAAEAAHAAQTTFLADPTKKRYGVHISNLNTVDSSIAGAIATRRKSVLDDRTNSSNTTQAGPATQNPSALISYDQSNQNTAPAQGAESRYSQDSTSPDLVNSPRPRPAVDSQLVASASAPNFSRPLYSENDQELIGSPYGESSDSYSLSLPRDRRMSIDSRTSGLEDLFPPPPNNTLNSSVASARGVYCLTPERPASAMSTQSQPTQARLRLEERVGLSNYTRDSPSLADLLRGVQDACCETPWGTGGPTDSSSAVASSEMLTSSSDLTAQAEASSMAPARGSTD
ncbi:hypothetical protein BS50DRAFT_636315 [Corynespora cassiicola Philippines]|uniref:Uncharacterized protein n=1 Tax=Corynespora cassiicola Philippines TaxID=1448308 RepID=A0A2T2NJE2_CORCC|nr:hypothetical protein BS50DRAFT_636315 [Corynespora cassiicola Philippines]